MKIYKIYNITEGYYVNTFETREDLIRFLAYHQHDNEWWGGYRKGLEGDFGYCNHYLDNVNLTFNDLTPILDGKRSLRAYVFIDPDDRIFDPRDFIEEIIAFKRDKSNYKYSYNRFGNNLPEFRKGPVPRTGRPHHHRGSYYRIPKTFRDKRMNCIKEYKEFIRGKRSNKNLPDPWDDYPRSDRSKSWKDQSKKEHQWEK